MLQAVLQASGRFVLREQPVPEPGPGQVLLRVLAVGVCGSDVHMFKHGRIGGIRIEDAGHPFVPGHEAVGRVEAVGPSDHGRDAHATSSPHGRDGRRGDQDARATRDARAMSLVGRRVFIEPAINCQACRWCQAGQPNVCPHHEFLGLPPRDGALTQYMTHPARLCEPLPDDVCDDAGVLLEPLAVAVHSLDRGGFRAGCSAVVLGAGPIGLTHVLLLAGLAGPLIVTDPLEYRLEHARRLGATITINPRRQDAVAAVLEATGGHGADFVFECAGAAETFEQMVAMAAPAARVAVVGIPEDDRLAFPHSLARRKGLDVLMVRRANLTFARALDRLRAARLPLASLATHHWPLDQVQQAFETAGEYRDGVVKAIVQP